VLQRVQAGCPARPVLLVLEDLQWVDPASWAMLEQLVRVLPGAHALVVGSYRARDLRPDHPLRELRAALARDPEFLELRLTRLAQSEASALIEAVAGPELSLEERSEILGAGEGHPFVLRELARQARSPRNDASQVALEGHSEPSAVLPNSLCYFFESQLTPFSGDARALLAAAACSPTPFSFDAVRIATELPMGAALAALDQSLDFGVIRPVWEPDAYAFTLGLLRRFLHERSSPSRRLYLHRRLAEIARSRARSRRRETRPLR